MNDIYTNQNLSKKIKHYILWDFEIEMSQQILISRPYLVIINKT